MESEAAMRAVIIAFTGLVLAGCVSNDNTTSGLYATGSQILRRDPDAQITKADAVAAKQGYSKHFIQAGDFKLVVREPRRNRAVEIEIALFGDSINYWQSDRFGHRTYTTPGQGALDDSGYYFDMADASRSIYILERPCFALTEKEEPKCSNPYWWTEGKYSDQVVQSLSRGISEIKNMSGATSVHLMGISSGGTLAVLIAASRDDIASIRTISAPLDVSEMLQHQSRMFGIRVGEKLDGANPIDVAARLARIPQMHVRGTRDEMIPQSTWDSFKAKSGPCVKILDGDAQHFDAEIFGAWRMGLGVPLRRC
jgi:pimeloyl-ACP methyl ester carboxylesterase